MSETVMAGADTGVEPLDHLADFPGSAAEFWPALFSCMAGLADARAGLVAVRGPDGSWARRAGPSR